MKPIILLILILFLVGCTSSMGFLPEPCANPKIDSLELNDYFYLADNIIDYNLQTEPFEENAFQNFLYADYYRQVLEPEIIRCTFSITTECDSVKQQHQGALYFSCGYLYITHFGKLEERLSFDPYQYVTRTDGVYSWKKGASKGTIFQRIPGDTLTFLAFYLDPRGVMRNLFWTSRGYPQLFEESQKGSLKILNSLDDQSFYRSFSYFESPLWLSEYEFLQGDRLTRFTISPPQKVNCIPRSVTEIPENIEWEYSEQGLASRQNYH